jgi:hypothetical protein
VDKLPFEIRGHYFLNSQDFFKLYRQKQDIYCITEYEKLDGLKKEVPDLNILWDNQNYYLIHLKKVN